MIVRYALIREKDFMERIIANPAGKPIACANLKGAIY
jgi:hypothetical protein